MKKFLSVIFILSATQLSAQNFMVPFSEGNLYGLVNEKGKVTVKPEFNKVEWLTSRYFKTTRILPGKDTVETSPGKFYIQREKIELTGLLFGDKTILRNEPFSAYEIIPNKCIVAKCDKGMYELTRENYLKYGNQRKFVSLFNLAGKNVYPKNFRSLQKVDSAGKHPSLKGHTRYILFAAEKTDNEKGFFVYDAVTQKISEWLMEGLNKVKLLDANERERTFTFASTDAAGMETRYRISGGEIKFSIEKLPERERKERDRSKGYKGSADVIEERIVTLDDVNDVAVPTDMDTKHYADEAVLRKNFRPFYTSSNDSLFYVVYKNERHFIPVPPNSQHIFLRGSKDRVQGMPVILKVDRKFFLADSSGMQPAGYDSMVYFGSNFLVWKKKGQGWVCGTIDRSGKSTIPMVYDSISAGMMRLEPKYHPHKDSSYLVFSPYRSQGTPTIEKSDYAISISQTLVAYKDGVASLVSPTNDILLPPAFELIAENQLDLYRPRNSEFIIIKKNGLYGVAKMKFNSTQKKNEVTVEVEPGFKFLPGFFYKNYYGIPGLSVFGLYDMDFNLKGFGMQNGRTIGF